MKLQEETMGRLMLMTVTVALLAGVAVEPAAARSERQKSKQSWNNLKQLRKGNEVQVVDQDQKSWTGRFRQLSSAAIYLQVGEKQRKQISIPRSEVLRVDVMRPSRRLWNALKGFGGGAWAGAGVVGHSEAGEVGGILMSAGAIIGGVTGGLSEPYVTVYEAVGLDVQSNPWQTPADASQVVPGFMEAQEQRDSVTAELMVSQYPEGSTTPTENAPQ